jgi:hypothetical protein
VSAKSHGRAGRPWRRLRLQVLERDRDCQVRGPRCTGLATTVDHIVPLSLAPHLAHEMSNLRGACGPCNYGAGARMNNGRPRTGTLALAPSGQPWRQTHKGSPCPVSNHGSLCSGGHLVDPADWRAEWASAPTWPDGALVDGPPDRPRSTGWIA